MQANNSSIKERLGAMKGSWAICLLSLLLASSLVALVGPPLSSKKPMLILRGHSAAIESIAFSPDGKLLASGSHDNSVIVWNAANGDKVVRLQGEVGWVTCVSFSPDGRLLAASKGSKIIDIWETGSFRRLATLKGHDEPVTSVAFSPDGKILASGSLDKTIVLWDVSTWKRIKMLAGHSQCVNCVAFSPDGNLLASGSGKTGKYPPDSGEIKIWKVVGDEKPATLLHSKGGILSLAFNPDGASLAAGSWAWSRTDLGPGNKLAGVVIIWDVKTKKENAKLVDFPGYVWSLAFSPNGKALAVASSYSDTNEIRLLDTVKNVVTCILGGQGDTVSCLRFSPDGKSLASGDVCVKLWRVTDLK